ncbi:MAG: transporter substrate-binding protein [Paenibacillus sp.]|nr:transporter substrate-binding protein [Paenibacillus sp.]
MKRIMLASITALTVLIAAGCGKEAAGPSGDVKTPTKAEPVTLQIASQGASVTIDEVFQSIVKEHISKKYPHITLEFLPESGQTTLDNLMATGTIPDIVISFNGNLASYNDKGLTFDMTPLFKTHNVDLSRFEPNYIDDVKNASSKGEMYGLPFNVNYHALYYNKDIFDKFGVEYPKDGMTWEELISLARRVTRTEGAVQFRGLDPGSTVIWMSQPLGIATLDPVTDKATMSTDKWKRVFELAKSIYDIPGNGIISVGPRDQFMKSKTLAMLLELNILTQLTSADASGMNWDIAQYPNYTEKPNTYGNASVYVMIASKTGKYLNEATKVMDLISSEEVQMALSKKGRLSPLKSEQVKKALGSDNPQLKDKKLPSVFKSNPVPYPKASMYRSKAEGLVSTKFRQYVNGEFDVNTALKQADEEINKMVEAEKGKTK